MQIKDWGEDHFIQYLEGLFSPKENLQGIGDDCAVIQKDGEEQWLVTTDALVEGVHFIREEIPAFDLGYKTIAVNVSDVAAMGGAPKYAFLSIALPKDMDCGWLIEFADGMKKACDQFQTQLLGGDTVGSKRDLFLNMTLIGQANAKNIKYRHSALPGDVVCVTGPLGESLGGLRVLQEKRAVTPAAECLIKAHYCPSIHLEEGLWLGSQGGVRAMMDLSDGLDCDLRRLLKASRCGAVIEMDQLPVSEALKKVCLDSNWDPIEIATIGGEDYCLLLTVSPNAFEEINRSFAGRFSRSLHAIGRIVGEENQLVYHLKGKEVYRQLAHFNHFQ